MRQFPVQSWALSLPHHSVDHARRGPALPWRPREECATPLKTRTSPIEEVYRRTLAGKGLSQHVNGPPQNDVTLGNPQSEAGMFRSAAVAVALALASVSTTVMAQSPQEAARNACQDDKMKLCAGVARDEGAIVRCLASQREQLSAGC